MDNTEYKVIQLPFESIGLSVRILKMDTIEDIESELSMFSKDKGLISKVAYEDYILSIFIINIGQLLYFVNSNKNLIGNFEEVRQDLLVKLYEINPYLNPEGIIVNPFGILKVKSEDIVISGYPLIKNKSWNDIPVSDFDGKDLEDIVGQAIDAEDINNIVEDDDEYDEDASVLNEDILKVIEKVQKVEHTFNKVWWDRLTMYLIVYSFKKEDIEKIISFGNYDNEDSYKSFIVTSVVKDIESIFKLIDNFGLLMKFTPQQMVDEMYTLCIKTNPELAYEMLDKKTNTAEKKCPKLKQSTDYKALKDVSAEKIAQLESELTDVVVGQKEAISVLVKAIKRARIGIKEPTSPIGSFLLAGQTGVGKTLLAKTLADKLFKPVDGSVIQINCSEYSASHEYSKLIGAPAGYVRSDEGGILTDAIIKNPFSVVLFDEIEKASSKVHQLLLQIMEDGVLDDNHGVSVSFKDCIILMTSNVGVKNIQSIKGTIGFGEVKEVTNKKKNIAISTAIKKAFKPEFLNRLTGTVFFNNIDKKNCSKIAKLELEKINGYLKNKNILVNFSTSVKNLILAEGYSEEYGARNIRRTVEKLLSDSLADYIIDNDIKEGTVLDTKVKSKKIKYLPCEDRDINPFSDIVTEKDAYKALGEMCAV